MRLGFAPGNWAAVPGSGLSLALEAERLGFDSVWMAEAYGTDAFTPLAWIGSRTEHIRLGTGIAQLHARTPAMTAMTASTLDLLSGGRLLLGLGSSGPQVIEGWHGVPYGKPLARTREYVTLVRQIIRREGHVEHGGDYYELPYRGADATGLGKPLKLIQQPLRTEIPIYLGAMGPKNIALAGEIADGWIPFLVSPHRFDELLLPSLQEGLRRSGRTLKDIDTSPLVWTQVGEDLGVCRDAIRPRIARTIGGYGARGQNFYANQLSRYGYEDVVEQIQRLYLARRRDQAAAAVPDTLIDEVALVGPRSHVAEQLEAWRGCRLSSLLCYTTQPEALRMLAELVL